MWSRFGPSLLLGAFAALLFKCAPLYTPLTLIAFLGYAATRLWTKGGIYLSLAALVGASAFSLRSSHEVLWTLILSISIALSWLLIYFGGQERAAFEEAWQQKLHALEKQLQDVEKQCLETQLKLSEEQRQCLAERQRAQALSAEVSFISSQARASLEGLERERLQLSTECRVLSEEIHSHQEKNAALQLALSESSGRALQVEEQLNALICSQGSSVETGLEGIQQQHALLREQFEEKSEALDQARKELFRVEHTLLSVQKMQEEKAFLPSDEMQAFCRDLQVLEKEVHDREHLIASLQDVVSSLLEPKKRPPPKNRKKPHHGEELLLESLINRSKEVTIHHSPL
jgi:chromosome segregation ATPase